MARKTKRTIEEVLDRETGNCINADEFFNKPFDEIIIYRSRLQQAILEITEPLFVCYYCKQKIRIRGGIAGPNKRKTEVFHFAHLKNSEECHIKTKNFYTKEEVDRIKYNGVKESLLHRTLKNQIAECLKLNEASKKEVSSIEVEKVIIDRVVKEWKKPDINGFFNDKRIAIELQLSTTWLDVITKRQDFYREQGIYIFWVFHTFNEDDDLRKLTFSDVIHTNNQNAYIFDKESYELSLAENDLFLKCFYKTYSRNGLSLIERWEESTIKLSDLTFDKQHFKIYFHDSGTQKENVKKEIDDNISELLEAERQRILREEELEKKRQEELIRCAELESKIQQVQSDIKELKSSNDTITRSTTMAADKLDSLKNTLTGTSELTEQLFEYFAGQRSYFSSIYENDNLLKEVDAEFGAEIKIAFQTIASKKSDEAKVARSLLWINKLKRIEISGRTYFSIDNTIDWSFVKQNYTNIKVMKKNQVDELFAEQEMKPIKSEYELNQMQFSHDIYFLIDFSPKVGELNEKLNQIQSTINQQEALLESVKKKTESKIEMQIRSELLEEKNKIVDYSNSAMQLNSEIKKKTKKLEKLEMALNHLIHH